MFTKDCKECGKSFRSDSRRRQFCSRRCYLRSRVVTVTPELVRQRFEERCRRGKSHACWPWRGTVLRSGGYGVLIIGRSFNKRAHRLAYELYVGPVPDDLMVCHSCDNPICVNPAHLWLGTSSDNVSDMVKKGRRYDPYAGRNTCQQGHRYTPENTYIHDGNRHCRACRRAQGLEAYHRRRRAAGYDTRSYNLDRG